MTSDDILHVFASGDIDAALEIIQADEGNKSLKILHGKAPLEVATCFGQLKLVEELVRNGLTVDYVSHKGYSLLHWAACWGHLDVVKFYVDSNVNIFMKNSRGETARNIAVRYQKEDCASYLQKAELLQEFKQLALTYKDIIADPEKNMGRFTKEDKIHGNRHCDEKLDWIENNREIADFLQIQDKKDELINQLCNTMNKLNG